MSVNKMATVSVLTRALRAPARSYRRGAGGCFTGEQWGIVLVTSQVSGNPGHSDGQLPSGHRVLPEGSRIAGRSTQQCLVLGEATLHRSAELLVDLGVVVEENQELRSTDHVDGDIVLAMTVAVRGRSSRRAISPKKSPAPQVATTLPSMSTSTEPSSTVLGGVPPKGGNRHGRWPVAVGDPEVVTMPGVRDRSFAL